MSTPHARPTAEIGNTPPPVADHDVPAVRVVKLGKSFGDSHVLSDVSLDVMPGEVVAVIGPSGAGKSTLIRCINFLEVPTSGSVYLAGRRVGVKETRRGLKVAGRRELAELRRAIGMVFQSFNLFPHLTALENVTLGQVHALGRSKAEARRRAQELLELVGLKHIADRHPSRLSGGEQQRVAIARALALDPKVMLFDEPTSAIDPELRSEVLGVIRRLAGLGMTMVVVTHEMYFAEDVADRVVFMAEGRVVEEGRAQDVLRSPRDERTKRFLRAIFER